MQKTIRKLVTNNRVLQKHCAYMAYGRKHYFEKRLKQRGGHTRYKKLQIKLNKQVHSLRKSIKNLNHIKIHGKKGGSRFLVRLNVREYLSLKYMLRRKYKRRPHGRILDSLPVVGHSASSVLLDARMRSGQKDLQAVSAGSKTN